MVRGRAGEDAQCDPGLLNFSRARSKAVSRVPAGEPLSPEERQEPLSARETGTRNLIARGLSGKEVAGHLKIVPRMVDTRVRSIDLKFSAHPSAQLRALISA